MNPHNWQQNTYAASCSVADRVLFQCLKDNPNIREVYLCLDNDEAGQKAAKRISDKLFVMGYGKSLDDQQRTVVVSDEDHSLVLAGAGSGKTLTIAGKVKYLCEERKIKPEEILLIAFTKKSAEEMTERIAKKLGIDVEATTFHKLGLDIIKAARNYRPDINEGLDSFVANYFENEIINQPQIIRCLLEYSLQPKDI